MLPADQLGTHYVLNGRRSGSTTEASAVAVTATTGPTEVAVTLLAVNSTTGRLAYDGAIYRPGETARATLEGFQSVLLLFLGDGRLDVKTSAPVSVFVGEGLSVAGGEQNGAAADRAPDITSSTLYQLKPVSLWGRHFISFPFSDRGDTVHITGELGCLEP